MAKSAEKVKEKKEDGTGWRLATSNADRDLLKFLKDRYKYARDFIAPRRKEWEYLRWIYDNKPESTKDYWTKSDDRSEEEKRRTFRTGLGARKVRQARGILLNQQPRIFVVAESLQTERLKQIPEEWQKMKTLTKSLDDLYADWWEVNDLDEETTKIIKSALKFGTAIAFIHWDSKAADGDGDVVLKHQPIFDFTPDPDAEDIPDCKYLYTDKYVDELEIRRKYGKEIFKGMEADPEASVANETDINKGKSYLVKRYKLTAAYFLDDEYIEVEGKRKKKYPDGRIVVYSGNMILEDKENPYKGYPFERLALDVEDSFWGRPLLRDIAPSQEIADMVGQQILKNMRVVGNLKVLIPEGTELVDDDLTNEIADVVRYTGAQPPQTVPPMRAAADGYSFYNLVKSLADEQSGIYDVAEGRRPKSLQSGAAILALQEPVNRSFKPDIKMFEKFLRRVGFRTMWLMLKNYRQGRIYRVSELSPVSLPMTNETGERIDIEVPVTTKRKVSKKLPVALDELELKFDIVIAPASTIPPDQETRVNLSMELFSKGIVDKEFVWEALQFNDAELEQRMGTYQQLQQQMQQMAERDKQMSQQLQQTEAESKMFKQQLDKSKAATDRYRLAGDAKDYVRQIEQQKHEVEMGLQKMAALAADMQEAMEEKE